MNKGKWIICDIDGTLTRNDYSISSHTVEVIELLHKNGYRFGIASGRPIADLKRKSAEWGLSFQPELFIGLNGAEWQDCFHEQSKELYFMKKEWLKEIIELLAPFKLNPFVYLEDGTILSLYADKEVKASSIRNKSGYFVAKDETELICKERGKIMFRIMDPDKMAEVEKYVNERPSPYYKAFKTQTTMLEFADRRVSKGAALQDFCLSNNISLKEVMAFGDMSNDNELLKAAGWGVCLLNGAEDTKQCADEITEKTNEEDGWADYILKHVLV